VAGRPLRPATRRRLGRPLPHQQADRPRVHPTPHKAFHPPPCEDRSYPVLDPVSRAYPRVQGRLPTCYSPVRRSCTPKGLTARLACVKHAASVRPEPGSNSPIMNWIWPKKPVHTTQRNPKNKGPYLTGVIDTLLSSQRTHAHHHEPHSVQSDPGRPLLKLVQSGSSVTSSP
jgi:hypothetical protein